MGTELSQNCRLAIEQPRKKHERNAFYGTCVSTLLRDPPTEMPTEFENTFAIQNYNFTSPKCFFCSVETLDQLTIALSETTDSAINETFRVRVVDSSTRLPWNPLSTKHSHFTAATTSLKEPVLGETVCPLS